MRKTFKKIGEQLRDSPLPEGWKQRKGKIVNVTEYGTAIIDLNAMLRSNKYINPILYIKLPFQPKGKSIRYPPFEDLSTIQTIEDIFILGEKLLNYWAFSVFVEQVKIQFKKNRKNVK